jgi:predicted acylesterase/phospholipase RssA
MTIKHLVISGGGHVLFQTLGTIQHLCENNFIDISNVESIYGTSAGALIGAIICMKFDWETVNDYLIKRPWHDLFKIKIDNILESYKTKGIFDNKVIEKAFKPLLDAKDIPMNINLKEFYELSKIEFHIFSFEINEYKIHDISYLTHPTLPLITAIQMSCAIPVLVKPVFIDECCYIDGGVTCNYPLNMCITSGKNPDEILGIRNNYGNDKNKVLSDSNLIDYLLNFFFQVIINLRTDHIQQIVKHEVILNTKYISIDLLHSVLRNIDFRRELLNSGIESSKEFLSKLDLENGV